MAKRLVVKIDIAKNADLLWRREEERLRQRNKYRALCLGLIRRGLHPSPEDLAHALLEPTPDPRDEYAVPLTEADERGIVEASRQNPQATVRDWLRDHPPSAERIGEAIAVRAAALAADTAELCRYAAMAYVSKRKRPRGRPRDPRPFSTDLRIAVDFHAAVADARRPHGSRRTLASIKTDVARRHNTNVREIERIVSQIRANKP